MAQLTDSTTVLIHESALFRRVEKDMDGSHQRLQMAKRGEEGLLGKYFVYDFTKKEPVATHVDLAAFAGKLGLLRSGEEMIPDE
jgi:hypothetical protein